MLRLILSFLLLLQSNPDVPRENDLFSFHAGRTILDAHNCYPYDGQWANRIDRALGTGFPVGIEQDIAPYQDPQTGRVVAKVTHRETADAAEPTLKQHFFERVRPLVERALKENKQNTWPIIVLHFDFKNNSVPTLEAVWAVLREYQDWITTGTKTGSDDDLSQLNKKPILVLTEDNDEQEQVFYRKLRTGDRMLLFGSAHLNETVLQGLTDRQKRYALAHTAPDLLLRTRATNYRRWWNNSWAEVEEGGAPAAADWTPADSDRLRALVDYAHRQGYWIRFYTLDGFPSGQGQGWGQSYNFGSLDGAKLRWRAAMDAGVDLLASDQYEQLRQEMTSH
jgi:hypothetical protein